MDINSASEKELATLKGIGDVRAKAIVKGRPYKGKDELVQKKIIPQNVYDDIKDQIIAKQDTAKAAARRKPSRRRREVDASHSRNEKAPLRRGFFYADGVSGTSPLQLP